jgi:Lon protease-like protein
MSYEQQVRVNFGKPMPLFPLSEAVLIPQQVIPLHIFEERYIQMVSHALDGAGQIAMAVLDNKSKSDDDRPAIRPAVCIGQIMQHETIQGGRFEILLQGVCRARIAMEMPDDGTTLYREAHLDPVEDIEPDEEVMLPIRDWVQTELTSGDLARFEAAGDLLDYIHDERISTPTLLELISFTLFDDADLRYKLLDEGNPEARSEIIRTELERTSKMLRLARHQKPEDWPKGMSWN